MDGRFAGISGGKESYEKKEHDFKLQQNIKLGHFKMNKKP